MEVLNVTDTIYIYLHRRQNRRASSSEIYSSFDEITEVTLREKKKKNSKKKKFKKIFKIRGDLT